MSKKALYLYLICHNRKDIKTHTYIGCVENFINRLHQHNGLENGGPRITKRAAGSWDPVIILKLPKDRTFDSKKLKREWKSSSRGLESRIKKGFELALKYNLTMCIMKSCKHLSIPILKHLSDKWKDNKIKLSKKQYIKLINV